MLTVRDILRQKGEAIHGVSPDASVFEALEKMASHNVGALVVLESDRLVGIVSERDYARKVVLKGKASRETRVREVMTCEVVTVSCDVTIDSCMTLMTRCRIRHLPVLEEGRLVGLVSMGDVVKGIISEQRSTIDQLEEYIVGAR